MADIVRQRDGSEVSTLCVTRKAVEVLGDSERE